MANSKLFAQSASDFRQDFNRFWGEYFKQEGDYLGSMTPASLIRLKRVFSSINGIVTMLTEMEFINMMCREKVINADCAKVMKDHVLNSSPFTNGFDLRDDDAKIIAEVKCNFPVGNKTFGAAQINAIKKDLLGLHDPSNFKKKEDNLPEDTRKFMVLLREEDDNSFNDAVNNLLRQSKKIPNLKLEVFKGVPKQWDYDTIYLVIVPLESLDLSLINNL